MQTNHAENPNTYAPLNRENRLLVGGFSHSHETALCETIAQTLARGERVLFIAADRPVASAFQQYREYLDHIPARTLSDLDVEIAPHNKPFAAFDLWDVIFAPPSYLHRQLVTRTYWVRQSALSDIGLVIIDGLDGCDAGLRAVLELGVLRFGLHPLDGIVRQVVVTMRSVQGADEGAQLADWLRAKIEVAPPMPDPSSHGQSAWTPEQAYEVILTLLASHQAETAEALYAVVRRGRLSDFSVFEVVLTKLLQDRVVTVSNSMDMPTYSLTRLGRTMAQHRLTLADAIYLHRVCPNTRLSWFDMLLIASATPDFPLPHATACPPVTVPGRIGSTLLQSSLPELSELLQSHPQRLQIAIQIALVGYYVIRGWKTADIAVQVHLKPDYLEVAILALQRRIAALRGGLESHVLMARRRNIRNVIAM